MCLVPSPPPFHIHTHTLNIWALNTDTIMSREQMSLTEMLSLITKRVYSFVVVGEKTAMIHSFLIDTLQDAL